MPRSRPTRTPPSYFRVIRNLIGEGHNQYVDDGFTSPDGKYVYFSRPSFADVVAINLRTGKIRWRTKVDGNRADHMAISKNGRRLLVSASTANVIDVIRAADGRIVGRIPSGDAPHESNFSRDGSRIFHASIGIVYSDADDPSQDGEKGDRVFEVIDARTLKVLKTDRHGEEARRGRLSEHERRRPADGDHAGRALRVLPGLVLLRDRPVRPEGGQGRQGPATCRSALRRGCRAPTSCWTRPTTGSR